MSIHKVFKPAKLHPPVPLKPESFQTTKDDEHNYSAMDVATLITKRDRGKDSAPTTPTKTPAEKKAKSNQEDGNAQVSNNAIFDAIMELSKRVLGIETRLEDIGEQNRQNSAMIANLTKAVQFNSEELEGAKKKVLELEKTNDRLVKENVELKEKVLGLERYSMRWCLRVRGVKEKKDENLRANIIPILQKLVPEMASKMDLAVDVVHRLGKREDNRTRQIIILFSLRHVKEEVWRRTKNSPICREEGISFAEMMPREDLESRQRMWPVVDQARQASKRAYFRGPHAYIEGIRVKDNG